MANAVMSPPQFDISSAVPETDDGKAISAMPAFDLNSAVPEESIQNSRPQDNIPESQAEAILNPSPISEFVRGFIKNVGKGGIEQFKEADYAFSNAQNIPTKQEGESSQDFEKRINDFEKPLDRAEVAKGVMGQLGDSFNIAIAAAAPEMSPKAWATLGTFMMADQTRQAVQNIFLPKLNPTAKDVLDIAAFPIEGGMSHEVATGLVDMITKAFTFKGISPTVDLSPDLLKLFAEPQITERPTPFVKTSQTGWPAPDIETPTGTMSGGVLDKLGISDAHVEASLNSGMPVRVPISKIFGLTPEEIKQIATFEDEGGAIEQEKQGGENAEGTGTETQQGGQQAQGVEQGKESGVHLRDHAENGMEAQTGAEVAVPKSTAPPEGEQGTSKIAKSVNAKAIEDKLTEKGYQDLAGYTKTNIKEISEKSADLVNGDLEKTRRIVRGEESVPEGYSPTALITAVEEHIKNNPDKDQANEMAGELVNSPLVSETSYYAKELRLMRERTHDSATEKARELKQKLIEAKGGEEKVTTTKKEFVNRLKKSMDSINLDETDLNIDKFLDAIKC